MKEAKNPDSKPLKSVQFLFWCEYSKQIKTFETCQNDLQFKTIFTFDEKLYDWQLNEVWNEIGVILVIFP